MKEPSKNFIKKLSSVVAQSYDFPMWGSFPPFPWKEFTEELSKSLEIKDLKISLGQSEWKKGASVLTGMGKFPMHLGFELSPIAGSFSLIFPVEDFSGLSSRMIHPKTASKGFSDPYLQKGFFRYLALESMKIANDLNVCSNLTPKLIDMPLTKEDAYCIDLAFEVEDKTFWARLIFPTLFKESIATHFSEDWKLSTPSSHYEAIFLDLQLLSGKTTILQEDWKKLSKGDFIILDESSYYPNIKKGTFQLTLNHTPLFQVKLKEDGIKILDYALYHEESKMTQDTPGNFSEDPLTEPPQEQGAMSEPNKVQATASSSEDLISTKKVPISLSVEVGRIEISLDKLLKLKPGNVIDLSIHPELGVNLVTSGVPVARGHLIQVGDVVGVKITEIT